MRLSTLSFATFSLLSFEAATISRGLDPDRIGIHAQFRAFDDEISRDPLKRLAVDAALRVVDMRKWNEGGCLWIHLIEVERFVAPDDARLDQLNRLREGPLRQVCTIGGYAAPLWRDAAAPVPTM